MPHARAPRATAVLEIRFKSTLGYSLLSIAPEKLNAGRVMIGSSKSIPLTLKNTGNEPLQFGQIYLSGNDVWKIADRDCWMSLAPGASCTLTLKFEALGDYGRGDFSDRLVIVTSNSTQAHNVLMTGTSISLPKAPDAFNVVPTYTGVSLSWQTWKIAGGTPVRGYFLHRYLNGTETTQWIAPDQFPKEWMSLSESAPKPGTTYALSIVNEVGEGPAGPPKATWARDGPDRSHRRPAE